MQCKPRDMRRRPCRDCCQQSQSRSASGILGAGVFELVILCVAGQSFFFFFFSLSFFFEHDAYLRSSSDSIPIPYMHWPGSGTRVAGIRLHFPPRQLKVPTSASTTAISQRNASESMNRRHVQHLPTVSDVTCLRYGVRTTTSLFSGQIRSGPDNAWKLGSLVKQPFASDGIPSPFLLFPKLVWYNSTDRDAEIY